MPKRTCFRLILLLVSTTCLSSGMLIAQRQNFSSEKEFAPINKILLRLKTEKEDTTKVFLLNDLNEICVEKGWIDDAMKYGYEALHLSRKIGFTRGAAITFTNLGHTYSYKEDHENSLKMYLNALHLNRKLNRQGAVIDTYINIGAIYDDQADYSKSLKYYMLALHLAPKDQKNKDYDLLGDIHQNLGITFGSLGNNNESLNQHFLALRNYEKVKDTIGMADAYNCLGNVYAEKQNYASAKKMYLISLNLYREIDESYGIANAYVNLGILFTEQNKLSTVKRYYKKALDIYREIDELEGQMITYTSLGNAYYKLGEFENSEKSFKTSIEMAIAIDDPVEAASAKLGLARLYVDTKRADEARKLALEALQSSQSIRNKINIRNSYEVLLYLESKSRDFEKAFHYQELFISYKDSINNEETNQKGMQIALGYSFQKKEDAQRIAHQSAVNDLNLRNQKNRYFIIVLILIIGSIIVVAFFARRAYNNRKRYSEVLANENTHKEMLLQEIHHRVNNSLQMISSLLSIQADSTDNEEIKEYLHKSENRLQAMSVMHQLLHLGNSKLEVNMKTYLGEVLSFYNNLLESKEKVHIHFDVPSAMFHTKTAMPLALILNELITNSLKYAFPNDEGEIFVHLRKSEAEDEWIFTIKDNGVGFDPNKVPSDSGSLGLSLVNLMTRQIDGKMTVDNSNGYSTEIRFMQKAI